MRKIATEVYSRVVGYHRPVKQWNKGKQAEFAERRPTYITAEWATKYDISEGANDGQNY